MEEEESFFEYSPTTIDTDLYEYDEEPCEYLDITKNMENFPLHFGFYEHTNSNFYSIEYTNQTLLYFETKKNRLAIKYRFANHKMILYYDLFKNPPTTIKILNKKNMMILIFPNQPYYTKKKRYEEPGRYFLENYNEENNLLCFDCPYRTLLFSDLKSEDIERFQNNFYSINKKEILINDLYILSFDVFKKRVEEVKEKIIEENGHGNDFYGIYITYANISEILQKKWNETVISIYNNFKSEFKIKKYEKVKRKDKNNNDIFIMKHIVITPFRVKIHKESLHESSRFLRLYFNDDNFIKIEIQDEFGCRILISHDRDSIKHESSGYLKIYNLLLEKGFNLCGRKYSFFLNPTSCLRVNCMWFIDNNLLPKIKKYYNDIGLLSVLQDEKLPFSKKLSRLSQNFTTTTSYPNNNFFTDEVINDITTKNEKYIFNDGCGKISFSLMIDICNKLNYGELASAAQIRYKGAKGVLAIDPLIKENKIILTKSMIKFNCDNCNDLEICRFAKYSYGYLNLQIIILLVLHGISKNKIYKIAKKEIISLQKFRIKNEKIPIKNSDFNKILSSIDKENLFLESHKNYLSKIAKSTYIFNRLSGIGKKYRFRLKNCCFLMGICDFYGILNENEVFVQICKEKSTKKSIFTNIEKNISKNYTKKVITGDILITRNPCVSFYDIQKVKAVYNEFFSEYFENVIIFPCRGKIPLPSMISGSDLDGDIYWICWEQSFVKSFKNVNYDTKPYFLKIKNDEEYKIKEEINNDYFINEKGEKEFKEVIKIYTYDYNIQNKNDINNILNDSKRDYDYKIFQYNCMKFHKYFHWQNKLQEISSELLLVGNMLLTNEGQKNLNYLQILEKPAYYHSIEVDFPKAGETSSSKSFFTQENDYPNYLCKKTQQLESLHLFKIKQIYEEYKKDKKGKNCFYDFFIEFKDSFRNNLRSNHFSKSFEKNKLLKNMKDNSFIHQLYKLINFSAQMFDAFLLSIHLISDEFFYNEKLNQKVFEFSENLIKNISKIFPKIFEINKLYEIDIKYLMSINEITIETELIYLPNFIEPRIFLIKKDVEDYRTSLINYVNLIKDLNIKKLELIRKEYNLNYTDIQNILLLIIFWTPGNNVKIKNIDNGEIKQIIIDDFIKEQKRISNEKDFINRLVDENNLEFMKEYFYENIKCYSLYNFYCFFCFEIESSK